MHSNHIRLLVTLISSPPTETPFLPRSPYASMSFLLNFKFPNPAATSEQLKTNIIQTGMGEFMSRNPIIP